MLVGEFLQHTGNRGRPISKCAARALLVTRSSDGTRALARNIAQHDAHEILTPNYDDSKRDTT